MPKKAAVKKEPVVSKRKSASLEAEPPAPKRKKGESASTLFERYKEKEEDSIGPDGVESLFKDLDISPASVTALVLAWKLAAKEMGFFKREEFVPNLDKNNVYDIPSLRSALLGWEKETLANQLTFTELYKFAFMFCCDKNNNKSVDMETAAGMLELVLPNGAHTKKFLEFLKQTTSYKVINKDQWLCFLEFSRNVKGDLSNYDDNEACVYLFTAGPLLIDEYVEFVRG